MVHDWPRLQAPNIRPPRDTTLAREIAAAAGGPLELTARAMRIVDRIEAAFPTLQDRRRRVDGASLRQRCTPGHRRYWLSRRGWRVLCGTPVAGSHSVEWCAEVHEQLSIAATLVQYGWDATRPCQYAASAAAGKGASTSPGDDDDAIGAPTLQHASPSCPTALGVQPSVQAGVLAACVRVFGLREELETSLMGQSINRSARLDASRWLKRLPRGATERPPASVRKVVAAMDAQQRAAQLGSVWASSLMTTVAAAEGSDGTSPRRVFDPAKVGAAIAVRKQPWLCSSLLSVAVVLCVAVGVGVWLLVPALPSTSQPWPTIHECLLPGCRGHPPWHWLH